VRARLSSGDILAGVRHRVFTAGDRVAPKGNLKGSGAQNELTEEKISNAHKNVRGPH